MTDAADAAWMHDLAAELGEDPLRADELAELRALAQAHPAPWGPSPPATTDLALAQVLRRAARLQRTRQRAWLVVSMAAALLFCASPTLVRWRVDRPGNPDRLTHMSRVGLVFWTSSAH